MESFCKLYKIRLVGDKLNVVIPQYKVQFKRQIGHIGNFHFDLYVITLPFLQVLSRLCRLRFLSYKTFTMHLTIHINTVKDSVSLMVPCPSE